MCRQPVAFRPKVALHETNDQRIRWASSGTTAAAANDGKQAPLDVDPLTGGKASRPGGGGTTYAGLLEVPLEPPLYRLVWVLQNVCLMAGPVCLGQYFTNQYEGEFVGIVCHSIVEIITPMNVSSDSPHFFCQRLRAAVS
jgi:hypothetical protein